jgi:hypothetical protein
MFLCVNFDHKGNGNLLPTNLHQQIFFFKLATIINEYYSKSVTDVYKVNNSIQICVSIQ